MCHSYNDLWEKRKKNGWNRTAKIKKEPERSEKKKITIMPLKNWCSIHARWSKRSLKHSIRFCGIFPSLKHNFIAYRSSSRPDFIFEIHQLWQSGFSRVYSNCCCSCSSEPEIIEIDPSYHKMYSNKILNFQESTTILNTCSKNLLNSPRIFFDTQYRS